MLSPHPSKILRLHAHTPSTSIATMKVRADVPPTAVTELVLDEEDVVKAEVVVVLVMGEEDDVKVDSVVALVLDVEEVVRVEVVVVLDLSKPSGPAIEDHLDCSQDRFACQSQLLSTRHKRGQRGERKDVAAFL